jgi:cytochrome c oxidase cbb3-type subunit 2
LALVAVSLLTAAPALAQKTRAGTGSVLQSLRQEDVLDMGETAYNRYCSGCHGIEGDGNGPAAPWLMPKPRDFTRANYKIRTTPSGALPTDADLFRTITEGVHGTSMPNWRLVPETTRWAMVEYLKTFAPDTWNDEDNYQDPVLIPNTPANLRDAERVKMGRSAYRAMGCKQCHGETGGADGPSSATLEDESGNKIDAANFHRGVLRAGRTPYDIYRSVATGFTGTPMPGFAESLKAEQIWDIVAYIRYVMIHEGDPETNNVYEPCVVYGTCEKPEENE